MALDSRDKRSSAVGLVLPWRGMLPSPGTIDQPDRQHVAFMYRGIIAGAVPEPGPDIRRVSLTGLSDTSVHLVGTKKSRISFTGRRITRVH